MTSSHQNLIKLQNIIVTMGGSQVKISTQGNQSGSNASGTNQLTARKASMFNTHKAGELQATIKKSQLTAFALVPRPHMSTYA